HFRESALRTFRRLSPPSGFRFAHLSSLPLPVVIGDPLGDCKLERRIATAVKAPHHTSSRQKRRLTAMRNSPHLCPPSSQCHVGAPSLITQPPRMISPSRAALSASGLGKP